MQSTSPTSLIATVVALVASTTYTPSAAAADDDVAKRVRALLEELGGPNPPDRDLDGSIDAYGDLEKIGAPAASQLVDAAAGPDINLAQYAQRLLLAIGRPALAPIRAKWPDLNDERRWVLVPVLEKHDREWVREYAWNCLDSTGSVRLEAWYFHLRSQDPRAKERYFKMLDGHEGLHLRWMLLPGEKPIFDEARENDLLISWLKGDSWVAKGEGRTPMSCLPPPWWPDGRNLVVDTIGRRGLKRAVPMLLKLLAERGTGNAFHGDVIIPLLGELGDKVAVPELKRILAAKPDRLALSLDDPMHLLHSKTARALWQLGDTSGRPLLIEHLKSPKWFHRRFAAEAIAQYAAKDDRPVLAGMLDDEDWGVRQAACEGLERLTGVQNRDGGTRASQYDAPRWKEWLKKNR